MTLQTEKNAQNNYVAGITFEEVRLWMTDEEVEQYSKADSDIGVFLSLILHRHRSIRKHIESLGREAVEEWSEHLLRIDESIQVYHFFYQSLLSEFSDGHEKYVEALNILMQKLKD